MSISSIDISMLIALRRARKPNIPIANSRLARTGRRSASASRPAARAISPRPITKTVARSGPDDDPDHSPSSVADRSRLARKIPPMTAASRSTPTISNGRTQSEKSCDGEVLRVGRRRRWPVPPHWVAADRQDEDDDEEHRRDRRGHGLGLEDEPGRRGLRLGEHDREEDQDADRADVDEDLGGGDERRAGHHVDPGEGREADHHREAAADDVAQRHDEERAQEHRPREDDEEDVVPGEAEDRDRVGDRHRRSAQPCP